MALVMKAEVADDAVVARLGAGEGQTGRLVTDGDISTVAQHRDIRLAPISSGPM